MFNNEKTYSLSIEATDFIKTAAKVRDVTLKELSAQLGYAENYVSNRVVNEGQLPGEVMNKLTRKLGLKPNSRAVRFLRANAWVVTDSRKVAA